MSRYIDVENIRTLFNDEYKKTLELIQQGETYLDNLAEGFKEASDIIMQLPTADVKEVVRGEWAEGFYGIECSNCGREVVYHEGGDGRWHYECFCPHCGADMRGEKNDA